MIARISGGIPFAHPGGHMDPRRQVIALSPVFFSVFFPSCTSERSARLPELEKTITPAYASIPSKTVAPSFTRTRLSAFPATTTATPTLAETPIGGGTGKIAFVSERDGNREIYVMNSDGGGQARLTHNPWEDDSPSWSPDGKKIAFRSFRGSAYDIFVVGADGRGENNVTRNGEYTGVEEPKWSPDGGKIVFGSGGDIYVINADGSEKKRITDNIYEDYYYEWSPDGRQIVFWSYRNGSGDIYVINAEGGGEVKLTNNPDNGNYGSYNIGPSWSPDGKTIIYISTNPSNRLSEIYAIRPDGSHEVRLTRMSGSEYVDNDRQLWSPDGKRIAFMYRSSGGGLVYDRICVMNSDGTDVKIVTAGPHDDAPRWSPDGRKIAFLSTRDGQPEIYVMNPDGSDQKRITYSGLRDSPLYQFQWAP
jgi:Tol biopolymer transport system component